MSGKRFCYTLNNPCLEELVIVNDLADARYHIVGYEKGENNTPHLQGYICFNHVIRFNHLKQLLPRAHWEIARCSEATNIKYCSKDNDYCEYGNRSQQGARSDLRGVAGEIASGRSMVDIAIDHPSLFIQYHRGMKELNRTLMRSFEDREVLVFIRWGVTGAGKTRYVWDHEDRGEVFTVNLHDNVPFDGYNGEQVLLFDDFGGQYDITTFLRWTDRYPLRINVKGSYSYANWTKVYFTSNLNPIEWFSGTIEEHKQAFMRRVTNVTEVPLVIL